MTTKLYQAIATGILCLLVCTLGTLIWTGCDTASSDEALVISPLSATVGPNDTVQFTVSGGYDYTWSLSPDDGSGTLNTTKGSQVTYTCLTTNVGTSPKHILVTSTIQGNGGGISSSTNSPATNSAAYSVTGMANIYYKAGAGASTNVSSASTNATPALQISETYVQIRTNQTRVFAASYGTPPYYWNLSGAAGGLLSTNGSSTTMYSSPTNSASIGTTNILTLIDSTSSNKTALIIITAN